MQSSFEYESKSDKNNSMESSIMDLSTALCSSDDNETEMPEIVVDMEKLPDVSTVIQEIVENGNNKHIFKQIYGKGDVSEEDQRKKLFMIAYDLYEKKQQAKADKERTAYADKVKQEDYETSRMAAATLKKSRKANDVINKSIEEAKALIAKYYKAIDDFN